MLWFFISLLAHLLVCFLYYLISFTWLSSQERIARLFYIVFIPVFGIFSLLISDLFKGKIEDITDSVDMLSSKGDFKYYQTADRDKEKNTVPLEEVLLVNDYMTKRRILLDVFKENPEKYIKELKIALDDPDTETSHYASAALMEINRKYVNSILDLSKKLAQDPDNLDIARRYATVLSDYIKSDITDIGNRLKYQRQFVALAETLLEKKDRGLAPCVYKALVIYTFDLGNAQKATELSYKFIDVFPENEISYFTQMQVFYQLGMLSEFKICMQTMKTSSVILSKEGLSTFRFFLRKSY